MVFEQSGLDSSNINLVVLCEIDRRRDNEGEGTNHIGSY